MTQELDNIEPVRWHVYPTFGPQHECSDECWCSPTLHYQNPQTGDQVWEHHVHH